MSIYKSYEILDKDTARLCDDEALRKRITAAADLANSTIAKLTANHKPYSLGAAKLACVVLTDVLAALAGKEQSEMTPIITVAEEDADLAERVVMQAIALQEQFAPESYEVPAAALHELGQALQALGETNHD